MKLRLVEIMSETVSAALGTSVAVCVIAYVALSFVTSSLEVLF